MNIKKKLIISNVLMLLVPVMLSGIAALIMFLVFSGVINLNNDLSYYDSDLFWKVAEKTDQTFDDWSKNPDLQAIKVDIDNFNSRNNKRNIYLSLYENGEMIYPSDSAVATQNAPFIPIIIDGEDTHTGVLDEYAFYSKKINNYTAVLACSQYMDINSNYMKYKNTFIDFAALLAATVIAIICITNYLLTRFLLKSIVGSLEILNFGVHQIQLGNLDYRIEYDRRDEFSTVCVDFNLMAQRLHDSVERQEKDARSRKELIAGLSHDLRTPLTSIKAYVEGLVDGIAATPHMQKVYLETIKAKAEDINQIVDKLFLFSKMDIGEFPFYPEKLNIGEELTAFITANAEEYKSKGLILKQMQNLNNTAILIDPVQFRNVLTNITENSVKYKNKECGVMEIACFEKEQNVCITLTDDGPGVPEDSLAKIFDIFSREDPSRNNPNKGSGLGLAITAKVIERSGGHTHAENVPDGGLRIVITMPICEQ